MGLPIDATLGERIRFYRQQAGLTQKELAGLCEVSESAIRNYELGNRVPDFLTLHTIAEKLRVNYAAISGEKSRIWKGRCRRYISWRRFTDCTRRRWAGISILCSGTVWQWTISSRI